MMSISCEDLTLLRNQRHLEEDAQQQTTTLRVTHCLVYNFQVIQIQHEATVREATPFPQGSLHPFD